MKIDRYQGRAYSDGSGHVVDHQLNERIFAFQLKGIVNEKREEKAEQFLKLCLDFLNKEMEDCFE